MSVQVVAVSYLGNNQFTICADAAGYAAFGTGSTMKGSTMFVFEPKCGGKSGIYKSTGHSTPKFSSALSGSTVSADCTKSVSCAFTDSSGGLSDVSASYIWAIGDTLSPFAQHSKYGSDLKISAVPSTAKGNPKVDAKTGYPALAAIPDLGVKMTGGTIATPQIKISPPGGADCIEFQESATVTTTQASKSMETGTYKVSSGGPQATPQVKHTPIGGTDCIDFPEPTPAPTSAVSTGLDIGTSRLSKREGTTTTTMVFKSIETATADLSKTAGVTDASEGVINIQEIQGYALMIAATQDKIQKESDPEKKKKLILSMNKLVDLVLLKQG